MNKDINNHQSEFDVNEIWAAIEPQVDEINARRKKRRPVLLYWLSGVGLLVGIIVASFFLLGDNTSDRKKSTTDFSSEINQNKPPVQIIREPQNIEVQKDEETLNIAEKRIAPAAAAAAAAKLFPLNKDSEINKIELNTDFVEKTPELILPSHSNSPSTPTTYKEVNQVNAESQAVPIVPQYFFAQSQTKLEIPKAKLAIETKIDHNNNNTNSTNHILNSKEITKPALAKIDELPNANIKSVSSNAEIPVLGFSIKNNSSPFPLKSPRFSIEFQGGISAVSRSLGTTVDNSNIASLVILRNDFEESLEAVHANLLINAHFKSGFYISSGVSYTRISELYFNNGTLEEDTVDPVGLQRQVVIAPGDTVEVFGPVVSTISTFFSTVNYNTYKFVDIPVFVGYEYDFGNWKADVSLGIFTNILLSAKGRIPNSPTTLVNLETNGRDIYRNRVGLNFQFGVGISKPLTDRYSIRLNPSVRYYSKNLINDDIGLSQKYLLFGGNIGIRMNL